MVVNHFLRNAFLLCCVGIFLWSCTEENPSIFETKIDTKLSGKILDSSGKGLSGVRVTLKTAYYNPIIKKNISFDKENQSPEHRMTEAIQFEAYTDALGNYCIEGVAPGQYTMIATDNTNKRGVFHPNIILNNQDLILGNDTVKEFVEITIHIPNSCITENSFLYIPGTDIYFEVMKSGTMLIKVPVGYLKLVFFDKTDKLLETLFLIIKNFLVSDTINDTTNHIITQPTLVTLDTNYIYTPRDTIDCSIIGAKSSLHHPLQYRFMWEDSSLSDWSFSPVNRRQIKTLGHHLMYGIARSAMDTLAQSKWSFPLQIEISDSLNQDSINAPSLLSGEGKLPVGQSALYYTGKATSNIGNDFQYQFCWGDSTYSEWLEEILDTIVVKIKINDSETIHYDSIVRIASDNHSWDRKGIFSVRSRARSTIKPTVISDWSLSFIVLVGDTLNNTLQITRPSVYGDTVVHPNTIAHYRGYGAVGSDSLPVEYRFSWGDSTLSDWIPQLNDSGQIHATHAWGTSGQYSVKVVARSRNNPKVVSRWSKALLVVVSDSISDTLGISRPSISGDDTLEVHVTGTFSGYGAQCKDGSAVDYRFNWGDSTVSEWILQSNDSLSAYATHSWPISGKYYVKVQARSHNNPHSISLWSFALPVIINDSTHVRHNTK